VCVYVAVRYCYVSVHVCVCECVMNVRSSSVLGIVGQNRQGVWCVCVCVCIYMCVWWCSVTQGLLRYSQWTGGASSGPPLQSILPNGLFHFCCCCRCFSCSLRLSRVPSALLRPPPPPPTHNPHHHHPPLLLIPTFLPTAYLFCVGVYTNYDTMAQTSGKRFYYVHTQTGTRRQAHVHARTHIHIHTHCMDDRLRLLYNSSS
jgi:hypothetical protein